MAKLMTAYLFRWEDVEAKSDLERLRLVLDHLPDETVMRRLEEHRKWGRDDYPIRPVWNSVLAGIVYQHGNSELRKLVSGRLLWPTPCASDWIRLQFSVEQVISAKTKRKKNGRHSCTMSSIYLIKSLDIDCHLIPRIYEWLMNLPLDWTKLKKG